MSLFVGNISNWTRKEDIEDMFSKIGKCNVDLRVSLLDEICICRILKNWGCWISHEIV